MTRFPFFPLLPLLNTFVGMSQARAVRQASNSSSRETILHVKGKGKWNVPPNNSKSSSKPANNPATKSLLVTIVAIKVTSSLIAGKRKPASTNPKLTPRSSISHTTKGTVFFGINANSSSITNHNTYSLDNWIVHSGCIGHMTYDKSILCHVKPQNSKISIGDALTLEAACMGDVFLSSSSQHPAIIQNVLRVPPTLSFSYSEQDYGFCFENCNL